MIVDPSDWTYRTRSGRLQMPGFAKKVLRRTKRINVRQGHRRDRYAARLALKTSSE